MNRRDAEAAEKNNNRITGESHVGDSMTPIFVFLGGLGVLAVQI